VLVDVINVPRCRICGQNPGQHQCTHGHRIILPRETAVIQRPTLLNLSAIPGANLIKNQPGSELIQDRRGAGCQPARNRKRVANLPPPQGKKRPRAGSCKPATHPRIKASPSSSTNRRDSSGIITPGSVDSSRYSKIDSSGLPGTMS